MTVVNEMLDYVAAVIHNLPWTSSYHVTGLTLLYALPCLYVQQIPRCFHITVSCYLTIISSLPMGCCDIETRKRNRKGLR
jgi:hypothetical protein